MPSAFIRSTTSRPYGAQPRVAGLEAAVADDIAIVVGELDDANAQPMVHVEPRQVPLQHLGVLETEHQAERLVLLRARDVVVTPDDRQQRRIAIGFALPERDVAGRRLELSALTVTLIAVIPDEAIASRCFCESGPRGGHDTFIEPGLASASMTMARS